MAAMVAKARVYDRDGNLLELEDGEPVPDGCRLAVPSQAAQ